MVEMVVAVLMLRPCLRPQGGHTRCGDPAAEGLDGREVDLREGRERLDRVCEHVERHAGADGEGGLLEPVGARTPQTSRDLLILVDEPAEAVVSFDLVDLGCGVTGEWSCGSGLPQSAVRPVIVVVGFEFV